MRARDWQEWIERWQGWAARELPGTRLSERERSVLLRAGAARRGRGDISPVPLSEDEPDAEAELRAARKLERLRLVTVTDSVKRTNPIARLQTKKRFVRRRGVVPTPLGDAVVAVCREQLENGGSLRWSKLMPPIQEHLAERR